MASYLSRVLTLDNGEELVTDLPEEQGEEVRIEVGSSISAADADMDVQEEAASIEEDLEAMEEGAETVTELKEQEDVQDELLENPENITPEIAAATQDALVISLAKLGITPEMAFQSRISMDSYNRNPVAVVRVTNDTVKDFLKRIKEHIMAFFRTVKTKLTSIVAKIHMWLMASKDKVDVLIKRCNKARVKEREFSISDRDTAQKIYSIAPMAAYATITSNGKINLLGYFATLAGVITSSDSNNLGKLKELIFNLLKQYKDSKGDISEEHLNKIIDYVELSKEMLNIDNSYISDTGQFIKAIMDLAEKLSKAEGANYEDKLIKTEISNKENYKYTNLFLCNLPVGKYIWLYRAGLDTETDVGIPEFFAYKAEITQTCIDEAIGITSKDIAGNLIKGEYVGKIADVMYKAIGSAKGYMDGMINHLKDTEKEITNLVEKVASEEEIKDGSTIKLVSQIQSFFAKATFNTVFSISNIFKILTVFVNTCLDAIEDKRKSDKAEAKREAKYGASYKDPELVDSKRDAEEELKEARDKFSSL